MREEREEMKRLDEILQSELEARKSAFKEEAQRREKERMKDFEAQVQAGLIGPDKLKKYVEAMGREFEEARKEPPPRDEQAQEAALREAQERMLDDQSFAWFTPSTPCPPNGVVDGWSWSNTWKSYDPTFFGGASAQDKLLKWQKQFQFNLDTYGGYTTSPLMAQAWGGGILRFKIPGQHIPYGKIEVAPYLNIQGWGRVQGGLSGPWCPGCGAWAVIEVQTRMGQSVSGFPYPWVKTVTPWTAPYKLWQEHSPPTKTQFGWYDIKYTGVVPQAKVVANVDSGLDVYIDVMVNLTCYTVGGMAVAGLYFDGASELVSVPSVCMKILAKYPVYGPLIIPPWLKRKE